MIYGCFPTLWWVEIHFMSTHWGKIDQRKSQKLTQIHDISVQRVPRCGDGDMTSTKQLLRVWAGGREAGAGRELQQMNLIMIINHPQTRRQPQPSPHPRHWNWYSLLSTEYSKSPQKTSLFGIWFYQIWNANTVWAAHIAVTNPCAEWGC